MKRKNITSTPIDTEHIQTSLTREHIEWATGGPGGAHVKMGGSCMRPDIRVNNDYYCDGCDYFKYCLVAGKRVR